MTDATSSAAIIRADAAWLFRNPKRSRLPLRKIGQGLLLLRQRSQGMEAGFVVPGAGKFLFLAPISGVNLGEVRNAPSWTGLLTYGDLPLEVMGDPYLVRFTGMGDFDPAASRLEGLVDDASGVESGTAGALDDLTSLWNARHFVQDAKDAVQFWTTTLNSVAGQHPPDGATSLTVLPMSAGRSPTRPVDSLAVIDADIGMNNLFVLAQEPDGRRSVYEIELDEREIVDVRDVAADAERIACNCLGLVLVAGRSLQVLDGIDTHTLPLDRSSQIVDVASTFAALCWLAAAPVGMANSSSQTFSTTLNLLEGAEEPPNQLDVDTDGFFGHDRPQNLCIDRNDVSIWTDNGRPTQPHQLLLSSLHHRLGVLGGRLTQQWLTEIDPDGNPAHRYTPGETSAMLPAVSIAQSISDGGARYTAIDKTTGLAGGLMIHEESEFCALTTPVPFSIHKLHKAELLDGAICALFGNYLVDRSTTSGRWLPVSTRSDRMIGLTWTEGSNRTSIWALNIDAGTLNQAPDVVGTPCPEVRWTTLPGSAEPIAQIGDIAVVATQEGLWLGAWDSVRHTTTLYCLDDDGQATTRIGITGGAIPFAVSAGALVCLQSDPLPDAKRVRGFELWQGPASRYRLTMLPGAPVTSL